ncbi:MAG: radical SAM protein [Candidatus Thermoplasmatota archaeon]|nr:radical SAM protein [Candidatus Thermoplasmatota archaeon]
MQCRADNILRPRQNGGIWITSLNRIAYGPVPSRRLGRSLGINNIPPKYCSYSCIYCQLGRTENMLKDRRRFYGPEKVFSDVEAQVRSVEEMGDRIDHLTFVPDGEPTLDIDLGKEIEMVKKLGYPVAVITNSSLLGDEIVREELSGADLVSVKVDSVYEKIWKKVNRPHGSIKLKDIKDGLTDLSRSFKGSLITETMLVKGVNDSKEQAGKTADFIRKLDPKIAYITVPIRPPAEEMVEVPSDDTILKVIREYSSRRIRVEALTDREYGDFTHTGDVKDDILAVTSVHPMREDSVREMLERSGDKWELIEKMLEMGEISRKEYGGVNFYRRIFW